MVGVAVTRKLPEGLSGDFRAGVLSWHDTLRREGRSPHTIRSYMLTAKYFGAFLLERGMPTAPTAITREHVHEFLMAQAALATRRLRHQALRRFLLHLVEEGELRASPMERMRPPRVPDVEAARPFVSDEAFAKMLATCRRHRPPTFVDRRDFAILLLLRRSGLRRSECAALMLDDVDTEHGLLIVRQGKGGRARVAAFDHDTMAALLRYVEVRKDRAVESGALWVGIRGEQMSPEAIAAVVRRRSTEAGLASIGPHQLRHAYAHELKAAGANDETLMALGGWRSRDVLSRYGRAMQTERAIAEYRRLMER
jgi:site-specific recombinase XerC